MQFLYILAAMLIVGLLGGRALIRARTYPKPPAMEPVAREDLPALLARLDAWLREHAPAVADALRPGLSEDQIAALEAEGRLQLSDDLRALYRWHDGSDHQPGGELIPGHRFVPLADAVRERAVIREQGRSMPLVMRLFDTVFTAHRYAWLHVLSDGCGDGYFYDPRRRRSPGSFFFNFNEDHWYHFFPTLADFVAAVVECFETGAFRPVDRGASLRWDFEKSMKIMGRYGATNRN